MKNILIPVDDSVHSANALQYAAMMASVLQEAEFSLFYVQPMLSDYIKEEVRKNPGAREKIERVNEQNAAVGNQILNRLKERLVRLDVPEEKIQTITWPRREGIAKDIIWKAQCDSVDAVLMGRRGFSKLQDTFVGSTTKNVIEHITGIPVWVIDGEITSRNLLLAVDGSMDSVRALDYLTDTLRRNPDVDLTLFHVKPSMKDCCGIDFTETQSREEAESIAQIAEKANRQCVDNFMGHAWRKLRENDISEDRLHIKTHPTRVSIGRAILEEFRNGNYGTLISGRRGIGKRFFIGSVSNYLVTRLENGALWIVP